MDKPMDNIAIWTGKVQSVNRWHGARAIYSGGKARAMLFELPAYKKFKKSLANAFSIMKKTEGYVDLVVTVALSSRADTGNIDKPIGDALEMAGVIKNDRFIRNIAYYRHYHPNSGAKNKYNDLLMVELIPIDKENLARIAKQQKEDEFNLRQK